MENEVMEDQDYSKELLGIIRSHTSNKQKVERLSDYHENDIANVLTELTTAERIKLYNILGPDTVAEIFTYLDNVEEYIAELDIDYAAEVIGAMDSDDAVDILDEMDEDTQAKLVEKLDKESSRDIALIQSYDDDEIGSAMTTNYIVIKDTLSIPDAMKELVKQAGDNDNISIIYVVDKNEEFYGAMDLKDLIIARSKTKIEDLVTTGYPYVLDHEKISDCFERIKEYNEDSIPVLNEEKKIVGIITANDLVEVVDDELGDDYAKLAGLVSEEDLNETNVQSMRKRLPWLLILLFLGMGVSSVIGMFDVVVAVMPILICFQSLILDMAGNVGTQSLAVSIRVLIDENLSGSDKRKLIFKEMRVGFSNGLLLGIIAVVFVGIYTIVAKGYTFGHAFMISGCVGAALLLAMTISSLTGTVIPMFFHKVGVDPAVASGPLITTVNDFVAVVSYYGLAWILLINVLHLVG